MTSCCLAKERRDRTPLTDEEYAFKLFEEENATVVESLQIAHSSQRAIDADQAILRDISIDELVAVNDYRYAQGLALGQTLPEKSDAQKALERCGLNTEREVAVVSNQRPLPDVGGSKPWCTNQSLPNGTIYLDQFVTMFQDFLHDLETSKSQSIPYTDCSTTKGFLSIDPYILQFDNGTAGDIYGNSERFDY
ncbi:hypothetical protein FB446DRAFT_795802 [Lentinula raphanica]|nr:hypothetical protein FB446DRAFT_795802 [Lentinula raphanica]